MNHEPSPPIGHVNRSDHFLQRIWVQRSACALSLLAPLSVLIVIGRNSIPVAVEATALLGCVVIVCCMVNSFDPYAKITVPNFAPLVGNAMKLLALLHGIAAIKLGVEMFQDESSTQFNELPLWVKFAVLAWLWAVAAIAFVAGDARLRRAKRIP